MNRLWLSYGITVVLLGILFGVLSYLTASEKSVKGVNIHSPLPDFLSLPVNDQVSTVSLFTPRVESAQARNAKKPEIMAKAALVYNLTTSRMLFEKNIRQRLPMASLTKIMTAIVALESQNQDDAYVVSKKDLVGENSMGVTPGEKLTFEELLYGLILVSGNDAAEVLASHYPRGRNAFIEAMNKKAKALGLTDTHFTNPTGLQGDGNQYTTVYDLLVITKYALDNLSLFWKIASTVEINLPYSDRHKAFYLYNETNLLTSYPGVKGVKTGYTPEAGLCLVTYLEYGGQRIIAVLLNSNNRRQEMKDLLNYSLALEGITPPLYR